MEIHVKPHPVDDCYWEFLLWRGKTEKMWYLWTVHEDEFDNDEFWKAVKSDVKDCGYSPVVIMTDGQLLEYVEDYYRR